MDDPDLIVERIALARATTEQLIRISRWNQLQAQRELARSQSRRRDVDDDDWDAACDRALGAL